MSSWPYRLGVILLSVNVNLEYEFRKVIPDNFAIAATRIKTLYSDAKTFSKSMENALDAADLLRDAKVDVVNLACTSGTSLRGVEGEKDLSDSISKRAGAPCITTAQAVVQALKQLGLEKIAVATPYKLEFWEAEKSFLENSGFKVLKIRGMEELDAWGIVSQPPETAYEIAKKVDSKDADGIFISCAALRTIEVLEKLEKELGKPVISSNTAAMAALLRKVGYKGKIQGYGSLLSGQAS